MADESMRWLEGLLAGETNPEGASMEGARCPKCNASAFIKAADLWAEAKGRLEEATEPPGTIREGGMTDLQIVQKFAPPRRKSAVGVALAVGIPLAAASGYLLHEFGETPGEIGFLVTIVATAITLMTMMRSYSDQYYHQRKSWNAKYMCRQCGQVVAA